MRIILVITNGKTYTKSSSYFLIHRLMLKIGEMVPDMELDAYHNDQITKIKLQEAAKGKYLVLVFYPADFTFVCPTELAEVADYYADFQAAGAEVMSVSTDTVFVHKAWHDKSEAIKKITYPMLADPTGKLCKALGTYIENEGLSLRGTFIFNPEGELIAYEMNNNSIGRSAKELLRKVQAAKFVTENGGEVCPASWEPGKETLKPGLDLVGEI